MDAEPQLRGAKPAGHRDEQNKNVEDLLQRAMAAEEAARKASEDAEKVLLEAASSQERHRLRGALGREDPEAQPLRGARPTETAMSEATHSLVAWWETFVPALTNSLATAFLPPPTMIAAATGTSTPKSASKRRQKPRRLYPSGMVSLVPDDYVPPPPVHDEVWDGVTQDGRRLHVKSFWRHFACYQDTSEPSSLLSFSTPLQVMSLMRVIDFSTSDVALPVLLPVFNDGAVKVLEQLGRYRSPVWYSPLLASAAPIMVEHELQYTRETIDDGYLQTPFPSVYYRPSHISIHPSPLSIHLFSTNCLRQSFLHVNTARQHYSLLCIARDDTWQLNLFDHQYSMHIPARRHQSTCSTVLVDVSFLWFGLLQGGGLRHARLGFPGRGDDRVIGGAELPYRDFVPGACGAQPKGGPLASRMRPSATLDAEKHGHLQDYIRSMCNVVTCNLGWRVCVLNWRGFNDAPISKSKVHYPVIHTIH
jgi:hypothetical protein